VLCEREVVRDCSEGKFTTECVEKQTTQRVGRVERRGEIVPRKQLFATPTFAQKAGVAEAHVWDRSDPRLVSQPRTSASF
jgi:hypothetical protein